MIQTEKRTIEGYMKHMKRIEKLDNLKKGMVVIMFTGVGDYAQYFAIKDVNVFHALPSSTELYEPHAIVVPNIGEEFTQPKYHEISLNGKGIFYHGATLSSVTVRERDIEENRVYKVKQDSELYNRLMKSES